MTDQTATQCDTDETSTDTAPVMAMCSRHGEYPVRTIAGLFGSPPIALGCPECGKAAADAERQAERSERVSGLMARSRIPEEYQGRSLSTFPTALPAQRQVTDNLRTWLARYDELRATAKRGSWLVMLGPVGSGKTGLACALMHELLQRGRGCVYHTLTSLRRWCWDSRHRGSSESDAVESISRVDLLVIDEIGASTASDAETALFGEIMANRCAGHRPTILISNLSREQLLDRLDERVVDRIGQRAAWIMCDWSSLRGRGTKSLQSVR